MTPPYPFLAFGGVYDVLFHLSNVAVVSYTYTIAPKNLVATGLSIGSVMCWVVGTSFGSFLSGLLVDQLGIRIMFHIMGSLGLVFFLTYELFYICLLERHQFNQTSESIN